MSTLSATSTTSRKATFVLEFVDSNSISWGMIARTIQFVDLLLERHLRAVFANMTNDHGGNEILRRRSVNNDDYHVTIDSATSRIQEMCDEDSLEPGMKYFCATMETTINITESSILSKSSQDMLDYIVTNAVKSYMQTDDYPSVLEFMHLTYLEPQWISTNRLELLLTGAIKSTMDLPAKDSFTEATSKFLSASKVQNNSFAPIHDSFTVIGNQELVHKDLKPRDAGNSSIHVNDEYDEILAVHLIFFSKLQPYEHSNVLVGDIFLPSPNSYEQAILSCFVNNSEMFVRQYLTKDSTSDYFRNVHSIQAVIVEDKFIPVFLAPTAAEVITTTREDPLTSLYTQEQGPFNVKFLITSAALLPLLVLAMGASVAYFFRRKRPEEDATIPAQEFNPQEE